MVAPDSSGDGCDLWVVGNVLIDLVLSGLSALPEWGTEVLATGREEHVGGQGANLARAAVGLGLATELISVVGRDEPGRRCRTALAQAGVATAMLEDRDGDTALAVAAVRHDGERAFLTHLGCSAELRVDSLVGHRHRLGGVRALALVGTANLPGLDLAEVALLFESARRVGVSTLFDPGWTPDDPPEAREALSAVVAATDVFLPNLDEAAALTGEYQLPEILARLHERCPGVVIVTCGSDGAALLDDGELVVVDALAVEVDNAIGAGDVFDAGVLAGLLAGGGPVDAAVCGTAAAASFLSRGSARYGSVGDWRERAGEVTVRRHI